MKRHAKVDYQKDKYFQIKYIVIAILVLFNLSKSEGQVKKQPSGSKANAYYGEAMNKYSKYVGNKDSMTIVFDLLNKAIKEDNHFYNAYSEIVAFRCQLQQYKLACQTIEKMTSMFPEDIYINLLCGALQFKTGHPTQAINSYNKVVKLVDAIPEKFRKGDRYNTAVSYKGIAFILLDKPSLGKSILKTLYNNEMGDVEKSRLAYYINSTSKEQTLDEVIPGNWH